MKLITLLIIFLSNIACAVEFVLPDESVKVNGSDVSKADVYRAVSGSAGASSQGGMSLLNEDSINAMTGVESNDSMANLFGSDTNLSITRSGEVDLNCAAEIGRSNSKTSIGIRFTSKSCSMNEDTVLSITFEWCSFRNGFSCTPGTETEITVPMNGAVPLGEGKAELVSCKKNNSVFECKISFTSVVKDSFQGDGDNFSEEGKNREDANPSFVLDTVVINSNSPYKNEINAEAQGSANFMSNSYEQLNNEGTLPTYRNSPEDIAQFGERGGDVGVPFAKAGSTEACTNMDLDELEECSANYPLTEYFCPKSSDVFCDYERAHTIESCTRTKNATCNTKLSCTSHTEALESKILQNFEQEIIDKYYVEKKNNCNNGNNGDCSRVTDWDNRFWNYNYSYPNLTIQSGSDNSFGSGFYGQKLKFDINDINKIKSFKISNINIDDVYSLFVNGNFIKSAWSGNINNSIWVVGYYGGKIRFNSGYSLVNDKGQTTLNLNLELKHLLVNGSNEIKIQLGVKGGGEAYSKFQLDFYCNCAFDIQEDSSCNALLPAG